MDLYFEQKKKKKHRKHVLSESFERNDRCCLVFYRHVDHE